MVVMMGHGFIPLQNADLRIILGVRCLPRMQVYRGGCGGIHIEEITHFNTIDRGGKMPRSPALTGKLHIIYTTM